MVFGILALVTAALFAGAAFHVSFAEHPARSELDDRAQLQQWKFSCRRATVMQGTLATLGFVLGLAAWWQTRDELCIVGAILMGADWAYTALMILPVNNELKAIALDDAGEDSHTLLRRWGKLHVKRTMLGLGATLLFLWASLSS